MRYSIWPESQINVKIVGSSNGAEQALDRVARKAEQALGKSISNSLDSVRNKAQKVFGVEIPGLMNAAKKWCCVCRCCEWALRQPVGR